MSHRLKYKDEIPIKEGTAMCKGTANAPQCVPGFCCRQSYIVRIQSVQHAVIPVFSLYVYQHYVVIRPIDGWTGLVMREDLIPQQLDPCFIVVARFFSSLIANAPRSTTFTQYSLR